MRTELLDLLILGLLVVLFGSIYCKRVSGRLRLWVVGWVLILLHVAALLPRPASLFHQTLCTSLSISALILAGVCFLLSASPVAEDLWGCVLVSSFICVPALFYTNYVLFNGLHSWPLYLAASVGAAGGTVLAWGFYRHRSKIFPAIMLTFAVGEFWTFCAIAHHRPQDGISAILAEIFLTFAALYWFDFRRLSAGVLTSVIGLVAWASVFPLSLLCDSLIPSAAIPAALWNVPKYFVAFGMILTLLEDEIFATGKASEHYRLLFVANPHPMWIYDPETLAFLRVNDAAVRHYGYSREEFLSMTLRDLRPAANKEDITKETERSASFTLAGPWVHRRKDGSEIQVDMAVHQISFQGRMCRFVLVQDVTERQRLHQQLVHQAHHDTLTGLPNRLLLEDRMRHAFAHAARHGQRAAVLCIDLDRFKAVNDTFGHAAGDLCLQRVATRISDRLRAVDTVARTGGEEFLIILGELGRPGDAELVATDLLESICQPIQAGERTLRISASMGIAIYPDDGTDCSELWRQADTAMYCAKQSGGSQFAAVSREIGSPANETQELIIHMRRMLEEGGFELHYQPQYSMAGNICGIEALLRLNHPRLGTIPPDRFIPIAEDSGLIVPLGNWVLEEVCRQSRAWTLEGLAPMRIAFNVSPVQFVTSDFSAQVMRALAQYEVDPLMLELEISEAALMLDLPEVVSQMRTLAAAGIHFSVDDFGTAYSSVSHLHDLPVSTLKIDCSFVERISASNGTYSIVQAIVALGHSLGLQVVAEGVERGDQLECLRTLGCNLLQGYLFAPPMPASRIPRHMAPAHPIVYRSREAKRVQPAAVPRQIPSAG